MMSRMSQKRMKRRGFKMVVVNNTYLNKRLLINLDLLKERVFKKKKCSLIIIDGFQGEGKSTLGVECADYLEGKEINLEAPEQYAVGGKDFQNKFDICIEKRYKVIIYDEAGDFDKYSTYTEFNKTMSQFFRMFRTYQIIVIMILPNFAELDPRLFKNGVPRLLLHCYGKDTRGYFKAYGLWRMEHLRLKLKLLNNRILPQEVYKYVRPNFKGEFYNLSPERSALLDKISTEGKSELRLKTRIKQEGLVTIRDLSIELNRSILWVKQKLALNNIKPCVKFKNTHYFNGEVLKQLAGCKSERRGT